MSPHVLFYAEDEENDIFFLRHAFKESGAPIALHTASTGPEAIAYLSGAGRYSDRAQHPVPGIVLLDVNLPGCSGFDVLKWLREQPHFERLPVIMFSSSARPEDLQKARELGASDYLQKPADGLAFSEIAEELQRFWIEGQPPVPRGERTLSLLRR